MKQLPIRHEVSELSGRSYKIGQVVWPHPHSISLSLLDTTSQSRVQDFLSRVDNRQLVGRISYQN